MEATPEAAALWFVINGYAPLDDQNCFIDIFTLNLKGAEILSGSLAMGDGKGDIIISLNLLGGATALRFHEVGNARGLGEQGDQGDQGWGHSNISVTNAIPEPAS